ncbi:MAG: Tim44 protein [Burkholderiales bacterium]|jgi:hypothetical protein|nr:Tim44 protein [Burkholderiales bacterium]
MKKFLVILLAGSLLFNNAFAGRFGGGRSSGMQRSMSRPSGSGYSSNYGHTGQAPNMGSGQQQQRSGMGAGTAAMLGAAAGAAGGYMLGKSNSNNVANNPNASGAVAAKASEETRSSIPWGTIGILIAILALGLIFFRRKINPGLSSHNPMNNFTPGNNNGFNMQNINRGANNLQSGKPSGKPILKFGSAAPTTEQIDKMPDGIETVYFLRQAKGMFLHIQSMNSSDNISEIQKYMTAPLFAEVKDDILNNTTIADFTNLDCQLMQCEAVAASQTEDGQPIEAHLVASVKFLGNVSENPEQPPAPFSEIWNFVKSESTNNKWIVAGIQQEKA